MTANKKGLGILGVLILIIVGGITYFNNKEVPVKESKVMTTYYLDNKNWDKLYAKDYNPLEIMVDKIEVKVGDNKPTTLSVKDVYGVDKISLEDALQDPRNFKNSVVMKGKHVKVTNRKGGKEESYLTLSNGKTSLNAPINAVTGNYISHQ